MRGRYLTYWWPTVVKIIIPLLGEWRWEWWEKIKYRKEPPITYLFCFLCRSKLFLNGPIDMFLGAVPVYDLGTTSFCLGTGNSPLPHPLFINTALHTHMLRTNYSRWTARGFPFCTDCLEVANDNVLLLEYFNMYKKVILTLNKYFKNTHVQIYSSLFSF